MIFTGDTSRVPEEAKIEVSAEKMLLKQMDRAIREYLVRREIVKPGATAEDFELAASQLDSATKERIKQTTRDLSYDLFLQMAKDQHNLDMLTDRTQRNRLTGLANKEMATHTFDKLKTLPEFSQEHNPLAVVRLDLDGFKLINDQAGHGVGDEVLKNVGQRIKDILAKLRTTDLAIHFSGDEFGLILTNLRPGLKEDGSNKTLQETVEEIVARIISSIEEISEVELENGQQIPISLSASAGFKLVQYGDISNFATIDAQAEQAALVSKNCKSIVELKKGASRIADADKPVEIFLEERKVSLSEYENSRIVGGFIRPTNDLLAEIAKSHGIDHITPEMTKAAIDIIKEAIAKIEDTATEPKLANKD